MGILTRYQLLIGGLNILSSARTWDLLSVILDVINIGCLYVCLISVLELTAAKSPEHQGIGPRLVRYLFYLCYLYVAALWGLKLPFPSPTNRGLSVAARAVIIIFGLVWTNSLINGYGRKSKLVLYMSIGGLVIFILIVLASVFGLGMQ